MYVYHPEVVTLVYRGDGGHLTTPYIKEHLRPEARMVRDCRAPFSTAIAFSCVFYGEVALEPFWVCVLIKRVRCRHGSDVFDRRKATIDWGIEIDALQY